MLIVLLEAACIVEITCEFKNRDLFQLIRNSEIQITNMKDARDRLLEFIKLKFECQDIF